VLALRDNRFLYGPATEIDQIRIHPNDLFSHMVRAVEALGNELLEIPQHPSLRELRVQYCDKLNSQVATRSKHRRRFGEHIPREPIIDGLLLQHLLDHREACAEAG
jgi:hypothetical protein